jgi:hypothetical protein
MPRGKLLPAVDRERFAAGKPAACRCPPVQASCNPAFIPAGFSSAEALGRSKRRFRQDEPDTAWIQPRVSLPTILSILLILSKSLSLSARRVIRGSIPLVAAGRAGLQQCRIRQFQEDFNRKEPSAGRRNQSEDGEMAVGKRRRNVRGMIVRGIILNPLFPILTTIPLTLAFCLKMTVRESSRKCAMLTYCSTKNAKTRPYGFFLCDLCGLFGQFSFGCGWLRLAARRILRVFAANHR